MDLSTVHTCVAVGVVPTHEIETSQLEGANPMGEGVRSSAKAFRLLTHRVKCNQAYNSSNVALYRERVRVCKNTLRVPTLLRQGFLSCTTGFYESFMLAIVFEEVFSVDLASNNGGWKRSAGNGSEHRPDDSRFRLSGRILQRPHQSWVR